MVLIRTKLRALSTALCASVAVLVLATSAVAAPGFQWLEPYDVTFSVIKGGTGPFTSGANFGQAATANLETTNLGTATDVGPSTAFMRAFMDARSGFISDTDATQVVDFNRAFRLSGSTNGWQVSITGFYLGFLGIQPLGSLNPTASVEVFGGVDSLDVAASPLHVLDTVALSNTGMTSISKGITVASLSDGNYEFTGSLAAGGSVLHSPGVRPGLLRFLLDSARVRPVVDPECRAESRGFAPAAPAHPSAAGAAGPHRQFRPDGGVLRVRRHSPGGPWALERPAPGDGADHADLSVVIEQPQSSLDPSRGLLARTLRHREARLLPLREAPIHLVDGLQTHLLRHVGGEG